MQSSPASTQSNLTKTREIVYPETDGKPMASNTLSAEIMTMLKEGLDLIRPDFVAMDLFWYPVQGHPEIVTAPDVLVAVGRPKGHRRSYRQWEEEGVPLLVVIEIWSPSNTLAEMVEKFRFYERHGVQEFYAYNPDTHDSTCWLRRGDSLEVVGSLHGHVSEILGIRFEIEEGLRVYGPDGARFLSFQELELARRKAESAAKEAESARAEAESARAEAESARAEAESARAEAEARAEALLARLRAAGLEP